MNHFQPCIALVRLVMWSCRFAGARGRAHTVTHTRRREAIVFMFIVLRYLIRSRRRTTLAKPPRANRKTEPCAAPLWQTSHFRKKRRRTKKNRPPLTSLAWSYCFMVRSPNATTSSGAHTCLPFLSFIFLPKACELKIYIYIIRMRPLFVQVERYGVTAYAILFSPLCSLDFVSWLLLVLYNAIAIWVAGDEAEHGIDQPATWYIFSVTMHLRERWVSSWLVCILATKIIKSERECWLPMDKTLDKTCITRNVLVRLHLHWTTWFL